jgi:hypothetical protein
LLLSTIKKVEIGTMVGKAASQLVPKNLQKSFESAVRDIYEVGVTGRASHYRTSIARRVGGAPAETTSSAEKRALADAARALALIWNVSPANR